LKNIFQKI